MFIDDTSNTIYCGNTPDHYRTDATVRCPKDDEEITGCGSTNVSGPDKEGFYDCLECGLWFQDERVNSRHRSAVEA